MSKVGKCHHTTAYAIDLQRGYDASATCLDGYVQSRDTVAHPNKVAAKLGAWKVLSRCIAQETAVAKREQQDSQANAWNATCP